MKNNGKNKGLEIFTLILTIFIVACIVIITILNKNKPKDEKTLAYTDLIKQVADGNEKKVVDSGVNIIVYDNILDTVIDCIGINYEDYSIEHRDEMNTF